MHHENDGAADLGEIDRAASARPTQNTGSLQYDGEAEGLRVARALIALGQPICAARPALDAEGNWDPTGGVGGYVLPKDWQRTFPTTNWLDPTVRGFEEKAWRPGWALCLVLGHGFDALDTDPRAGGDVSRAELIAAGKWPTVYAVAETPSAPGTHELVAGLGVGSVNGFRPGLDLKGGRADGTGRGFVFIAPTRKLSKTSGAVASYRWMSAPDALPADDDSGAVLREIVRPTPTTPPRRSRPSVGPAGEHDADRLAGWTASAVRQWQDDLRSALAWPEGYTDERGRGWQKLCADAAMRLGSLARADWCPLTLQDAERAFLEAAPRGASYDVGDIWRRQSVRGETADYPPPRESLADEVSTWANDPGVRVDPALRQQPSQHAARRAGSEQYTDAHLADRVAADALADRFCWSAGLGWLAFDGRRWAGSDEAEVTDVVRRYLITWHTRDANDGADSTHLKMLSGLLSRNRIAAVVSLTRGVVRVDPAEFDSHPDLLNVGNGVVDLRTGTLLPHDPALMMTKVTEVDYRPGARHPDWDAALRAVPSEVVPYLQERYGQAATGYSPPDDTFVVKMGAGANGKSTVIAAVGAALGEHAVTLSERALFGDPSQHPTEFMPLRGARFASTEEIPEGGRLNVKRLKDTVGTPTMTARGMRQDPITWRTSHTLFLTTNYLPQVNEVDHGTWRRLALVRFPYTFVPPGRPLTGPMARHGVPGLRERLLHGADGRREAVLAWVVGGARRWYAAGAGEIPMPDVVRADTDAWRGEADRVHAYFGERLTLDSSAHVVATDLFADFVEWLSSHGYAAWSDQTFAGRFGSHELVAGQGIEKRRVSAGMPPSRRPGTLPASRPARYMAWVGVRFRTSSDLQEEASWQAWQGSPDTSPMSPSYGTYPETPASPASAWDALLAEGVS